MGLSRDASISMYGTERYTGWGEAEAAADARAKGISGGSSNSNEADYNARVAEYNAAIDRYADWLISQASGDYDWAAKWIESNYTQALGTDNAERAAFIKEIANSLEKKIGTVAFDYETNKYRTISDRDLALKRLDEDEAVFKRTTQTEREAQQGGLNARGLVNARRDQAQGLYGKEVGEFEQGVNDRMMALQRARDDTNLLAQRSLEDTTTTARRSAGTSQDARDYQIEQAKRAKEKAQKQAEVYRSTGKVLGEGNVYSDFYGA